jgi:hypothetical protein
MSYQPPMWNVSARTHLVRVGRPGPAVQRSVWWSVHRGDDLAHHAAGQVAELPQWQQVEQLTRGQLRRCLSKQPLLLGGAGRIVDPVAAQRVSADLDLVPAEPGTLVGSARPLLGLQVVVELRDAEHHAPERRRPGDGSAPLRLGVVGATPRADPPVGAGQTSGPLDRVVPVLELVDAGVEVAVGGVPAADVLHHHEVTGSGQLYGVGIDRVDVGVLVVRLPRQQHGVRTIV